MKLLSIRLLAAGAAGLAIAACVHTPPGTSVEIALAKRAELVRLPKPPEPPPSEVARIKPVEPDLPNETKAADKLELVADAFTRGQFAMKAGRDVEAISAFEEAVKLDPNFSEGWQNLAILYEKTGQPKKAMEAFRKSKKVGG